MEVNTYEPQEDFDGSLKPFNEEKQVDVFRDTYIRYLGYANEVGEAFRPIIHKSIVNSSYGVATIYVLADTWDKTRNTWQKPGSTTTDTCISAGDTLLWQGFASIIIPGYTINRITYFTTKMLKKNRVSRFASIIPTAAGLLSIPLIIKPIDHAVDFIMDKTYRKWLK